jgi:hypothetical protein
MTKMPFESLVASFRRDVEMVRDVRSPNPNDDDLIKAAIVGFSYNAPTTSWGSNHFAFVRRRLDGDYSEQAVSLYAEQRHAVRLFAAICLGYMLGLYEMGRFTDAECQTVELQLPGIIALHCDKIKLIDRERVKQ